MSFIVQLDFTSLSLCDITSHMDLTPTGCFATTRTGLLYTFADLVNRVGTQQSTDWLVTNIIFSPREIYGHGTQFRNNNTAKINYSFSVFTHFCQI